MLRIRQGWLVVVLGLGLFAACKKDDKSSSLSGDKPAEAAPEASASGAAGGDDLGFLPADSELVVGINFGQVQQSALWKQLVEPKLMAGELQRKLSELKTKCGFDPMTAVKSASLGMRGGADDKPSGVIVIHGLDKAKTLDCIDKNKDEVAKDWGEMTRDGDVVLIKNPRGEPMAFSFINTGTAIVLIGESASAAGVKAVAAGGSALRSSPAFLEMYKQVNSRDPLWLLINGKALDRFSVLPNARAVFGSLNVTDGLTLDMRIRFEKPEDATRVATLANGQAKQAAVYVDKAEFTSDGPDLHASIAMSNQKLQALISEFGGLFGALVGGMGGQ